jgi:hypothetical protein
LITFGGTGGATEVKNIVSEFVGKKRVIVKEKISP